MPSSMDELTKASCTLERWLDTFSEVSEAFVDEGIKHTFIKMLIDPRKMGDIDVLIPGPDASRAAKLLESMGYRLERAGRLLHPQKVMCFKDEHLHVDIHPDAEWNRTKVADGRKIVERSKMEKYEGVRAYLPAPDDSFYLIATHSVIQHLRIRHVEVMTGIELISDPGFSWTRIKQLSDEFGTLIPIYAFLKIAKMESNDDVVGDIVKMLNPRLSNFIDSMMESQIKDGEVDYPVLFPMDLCMLLSIVHTPKLIGKVKPQETIFDFLSHYMRLIGGRGI